MIERVDKLVDFFRRRSVRVVLATALLTLMMGIEAWVDPFGFSSTTDHLSGALVTTMLSPFYGNVRRDRTTPSPEAESEVGANLSGRDSIVVLLYDEAYTEARNNGQWPIPFAQHRSLINRVVQAGATAVFLDVYFTRHSEGRRENLGRFINSLEKMHCPKSWTREDCQEDSRAPIVLASLLSDPEPDLETLLAEGTDFSLLYGLAEAHVPDHLYRLTDKSGQGRQTAAYRLYNIWCRTNACPPMSPEEEDAELSLQWGYAPNTDMASYYKNASGGRVECQSADSFPSQFGHSLRLFSAKLLSGSGYGFRPRCLYHTHVSALYAQTTSLSVLQEIVNDRIVLIGTDLDVARDTVESYVHGHVPGVFWHAAALDNLIEYKNLFRRQVAPPSLSALLQIVTALAVFSLYGALNWKADIYEDKLQQLMANPTDNLPVPDLHSVDTLRILVGFIITLTLAAMICLVWLPFRFAPENWMSIAAILLIISTAPFVSLLRRSAYLAARALEWVDIRVRSRKTASTQAAVVSDASLKGLISGSMLFIVFLIVFALGLILAFAMFCVPIAYFMLQPESGWLSYTIFALSYLGLAGAGLWSWERRVRHE